MARTTADESAATREAILRAAIEEIAEHGYAGLRVPKVAARVHKTQGAVYARFPNKEALVLAALRELRDGALGPRVAAALAAAPADHPLVGVEALSRAIARFAEEDAIGQRAFARLSTELAYDTGPIAEEMEALYRSFTQLIGGLFTTAGVHPEPHALAAAVVGLPVAFMTAAAWTGHDYAELEAILAPILTAGLLAPERAEPDTGS